MNSTNTSCLMCTGRKKSEYRQGALMALEISVRAFKDQDYFATVGPPLIAALEQHEEAVLSSKGVRALCISCNARFNAGDAMQSTITSLL